MATILTTAHAKVYAVIDNAFIIQTEQLHTVANLAVPSVTVEAVGQESDNEAWSNDILLRHLITISVRVHTSYSNFARNTATTLTHLDTAITAIKASIDLDDSYRVWDIGVPATNVDFEDSATRGGELLVQVLKIERHTQT